MEGARGLRLSSRTQNTGYIVLQGHDACMQLCKYDIQPLKWLERRNVYKWQYFCYRQVAKSGCDSVSSHIYSYSYTGLPKRPLLTQT